MINLIKIRPRNIFDAAPTILSVSRAYFLNGVFLLTALFSTSPLHAQSIDYEAMELLFEEPVTVSATGKPQRVSDAPVTMEILTAEDIRRSGAINLPEALRQVNGIDIIQGTEQGYDVSIRGYNQGSSARLLVLVNGRQVYLDHYGLTAWSAIPVQLEEIQQIEIVKGPNTALFGFNAVSGVINIVTYNPLYNDKSSTGVTVGTQNYKKAHHAQTLNLSENVGVRISGGIESTDSFGTSANGLTNLTSLDGRSLLIDPKKKSFNLDSLFQVTDTSQVRFEASTARSEQGEYITNGGMSAAKYKVNSLKLGYEVDSSWGLIKASIYKNILDWKPLPSLGLDKGNKVRNEIIVAQLENTLELGAAHIVRLQGEFRENSMTSDNLLISDDAEISYNVYAGGIMWDWQINDKISLVTAGRLDHLTLNREGSFNVLSTRSNEAFDTNTSEFSYNAGIVYQPTDQDTFRLSTARGIEIPSLVEYGIDVPVIILSVEGNPLLSPTIVDNYEIAWDRKLGFIEQGLFRTAVFHQKSKDIKTVVANQDFVAGVVETDNIGDSDSFGLEVAVSGKYEENFDWEASYTYQEIDDELENSNGTNQNVPKQYEDAVSNHRAQLKLGYKNKGWELDGLAYYQSARRLTVTNDNLDYTPEKIDGYIGVNARIAYTFDNDITVAVHGSNIQSPQTQTAPTPDIERRVYFSISKTF